MAANTEHGVIINAKTIGRLVIDSGVKVTANELQQIGRTGEDAAYKGLVIGQNK